ncbi:hypothetical protein CBQ26_11955 [Deinococcus indicus]|uniref:Uncharacterized protein n=1 Tax=Deinococcus indicus TaxID=223556 RepID=A0A246BJH6_9DEIO|nr:hypothetical protein [Deinococcus indicus]OWL95467.1 hypothetical protein CBQ26_11955 [Deinococcus indicus]
MTGWSEPFRWTVVVQRALVGETEAAVRALAVRVVACCPEAASVIVSSCAGVGLLDAEGEVLDVANLDADVAVEVAELFGVGVYALPLQGRPGCRVEAAYEPKVKPKVKP